MKKLKHVLLCLAMASSAFGTTDTTSMNVEMNLITGITMTKSGNLYEEIVQGSTGVKSIGDTRISFTGQPGTTVDVRINYNGTDVTTQLVEAGSGATLDMVSIFTGGTNTSTESIHETVLDTVTGIGTDLTIENIVTLTGTEEAGTYTGAYTVEAQYR